GGAFSAAYPECGGRRVAAGRDERRDPCPARAGSGAAIDAAAGGGLASGAGAGGRASRSRAGTAETRPARPPVRALSRIQERRATFTRRRMGDRTRANEGMRLTRGLQIAAACIVLLVGAFAVGSAVAGPFFWYSCSLNGVEAQGPAHASILLDRNGTHLGLL